MRPFADATELFRKVERLVLPAECLLCREPLARADGDALVCGLCRSRWRRPPHPLCPRCGAALDGVEPCRLCTAWPDQLRQVRSAVWLDASARKAVHQLKYDGWWRIAECMATEMHALEPLTGEISLIPIPLASRRLRRRGYNQSERLATALGTVIGRPVVAATLRRARETPTQTRLSPEERAANVAGAFSAQQLPGGALVLVDDVFTTGATLVAAGEALAEAGCTDVRAVTFARARSDIDAQHP